MAQTPEHIPGDSAGGGQPRPDQPASQPSDGATVLTTPRAHRLILFLGLPTLVALAGLCLPPLAGWALDLDTGLPVRPVFWALGSIDQPWKIATASGVGFLIGLMIAFAAAKRATKVTLTDAELRVQADDRTQTVARADVGAVFLDGKKLVVLDAGSRQLVSATLEEYPQVTVEAFRAHRYPWQDSDPYADLYRQWVPDTGDLPAEVNAVLAAREAALKKKAGREVRDLRDAVQKLGFVVREDGTKQFWRPLVRS